MSQKRNKQLRKFGKLMGHTPSQHEAAKALYGKMNRVERRQLTKEMRQYQHEQAQSIEGLAK